MISKRSVSEIVLGMTLLVCGSVIYLLFRSKSLNIYQWCVFLGFDYVLDLIRMRIEGWLTSDFIRYSLPDGLYCAAYLLMMDAIWNDEKGRVKYLLMSIVPIITITSEILQLYNVVPGTFDIMDMVCYCVPPLMYIGIIYTNTVMFNNLKFKDL